MRISGNPTPEEEAAIIAALEQLVAEDKKASAMGRWKLSGRLMSVRRGYSDLRGAAARRMSGALVWKGSSPQDLRGRGDVK